EDFTRFTTSATQSTQNSRATKTDKSAAADTPARDAAELGDGGAMSPEPGDGDPDGEAPPASPVTLMDSCWPAVQWPGIAQR
ncbi:unnamed protein product, partial [Linum tenue]